MAQSAIHQQLLLDGHYLGRLPLSHLLLYKNGVIPWFILVPETDVGDLLDLPEEFRRAAIGEAALISAFVKQTFGCAKVNFASIGNVVPQLHLHIVGRKSTDPCWPAPVWGTYARRVIMPTRKLALLSMPCSVMRPSNLARENRIEERQTLQPAERQKTLGSFSAEKRSKR